MVLRRRAVFVDTTAQTRAPHGHTTRHVLRSVCVCMCVSVRSADSRDFEPAMVCGQVSAVNRNPSKHIGYGLCHPFQNKTVTCCRVRETGEYSVIACSCVCVCPHGLILNLNRTCLLCLPACSSVRHRCQHTPFSYIPSFSSVSVRLGASLPCAPTRFGHN